MSTCLNYSCRHRRTSSQKLTMGAARSSIRKPGISSSENNEKQAESKKQPAPPPPSTPLPAPQDPPAPHKFQEIIATATNSEEKNPDPAVKYSKVYFLQENTKKYWVEDNVNYFMLLPRGLSITWGSDARYWAWKHLEEESGADAAIEVAELKNVCWLEVDGKMELSHLTPGVVYEVVFEIKLKTRSDGWSAPVNLRLKFPDGSVQERKEVLKDKPREQWLDIMVGEIKPQKGQRGDLSISLFQFAGEWKKGLVIKGVKITPKKSEGTSISG